MTLSATEATEASKQIDENSQCEESGGEYNPKNNFFAKRLVGVLSSEKP